MKVPVRRIAEKFIAYYWRQAMPYVPQAGEPIALQQNTDRQAAIINLIADAQRRYGPRLRDVRAAEKSWSSLVTRVLSNVWRLQQLGGKETLEFLYANRDIGTRVESIELLPGVAYCLRKFHPLLTELIRGAWLQYIRRQNAAPLGTATDLSEFLFGGERMALGAVRPTLEEIQAGRCFYCRQNMNGDDAAVDHFIPWSRYPADLGHKEH